MKYLVEATPTGFRMTMLRENQSVPTGVQRHINEDGGHGPVERLYAEAEKTWHNIAHGRRWR